MSRSHMKNILPALSISNANTEGLKGDDKGLKFAQLLIPILGFAKFLIDLADVLRNVTNPVSNVRHCWREFVQNSMVFVKVWFEAVEEVIIQNSAELKGTLEHFEGHLPDLGFLDSNGTGDTGKTWEQLIEHFHTNLNLLNHSLWDLTSRLGPHMDYLLTQIDGKITPRSFPEIVLNTILIYRKHYRPNDGLGDFLLSVTAVIQRSSRTQSGFGTEKQQKRQGTLACVAAMALGDDIWTGSTKIYYGKSLGKYPVKIGGNVEDFFARLRHQRYDDIDYLRIKQLIEPQFEYCKNLKYELIKAPNPLSDTEATEAALRQTHDTAEKRLPEVLLTFVENARYGVCLAYKGDGSFAMKDKCCICDCTYRIKPAGRVSSEPSFSSAAELSKSMGLCGVYAEALAFVQLLRKALPDWLFGS